MASSTMSHNYLNVGHLSTFSSIHRGGWLSQAKSASWSSRLTAMGTGHWTTWRSRNGTWLRWPRSRGCRTSRVHSRARTQESTPFNQTAILNRRWTVVAADTSSCVCIDAPSCKIHAVRVCQSGIYLMSIRNLLTIVNIIYE